MDLEPVDLVKPNSGALQSLHHRWKSVCRLVTPVEYVLLESLVSISVFYHECHSGQVSLVVVGSDTISPKLLNSLASVITPAIARIFQTSFDEGTVPKNWRKANIVPIFKKGDKSKPANYRPVSLTTICSKTFHHFPSEEQHQNFLVS
jgi:hypothetical protein